MSIWRSLVFDLRRELEARPAYDGSIRSGLRVVLNEVGLRIVMQYRLAMLLQARGMPVLPRAINRRLNRHYGIDITRGAQFGYRVQIPHPVGVVIGEGVTIEDGALIQAHVVLGVHLSERRPDGYPRIGRSAHLGAGSRVLGPVTVGERAEVGANAVVIRDVEPWTVVAGIPARLTRSRQQRHA